MSLDLDVEVAEMRNGGEQCSFWWREQRNRPAWLGRDIYCLLRLAKKRRWVTGKGQEDFLEHRGLAIRFEGIWS